MIYLIFCCDLNHNFFLNNIQTFPNTLIIMTCWNNNKYNNHKNQMKHNKNFKNQIHNFRQLSNNSDLWLLHSISVIEIQTAVFLHVKYSLNQSAIKWIIKQ